MLWADTVVYPANRGLHGREGCRGVEKSLQIFIFIFRFTVGAALLEALSMTWEKQPSLNQKMTKARAWQYYILFKSYFEQDCAVFKKKKKKKKKKTSPFNMFIHIWIHTFNSNIPLGKILWPGSDKAVKICKEIRFDNRWLVKCANIRYTATHLRVCLHSKLPKMIPFSQPWWRLQQGNPL